ncbi:hypothetical protein DS884_17550 [Tenacibaculum sp. E3R01]|uniref:glycosyltransferase family 4 protein n=1 Tax=Tenacibaculum sp. E3R01 TaxID=2267227 RepID=UPI000DEA4B2B|nr:glycosyltransferase family 4 protein [Tenacibaculum sp. E3R01]RBW54259.1 hypothetical protein DS884_17550 [Tenacibaculum sp. E3R01]
MKRILFIHHAAGWGGAPNSMIKLINSLDKNKFSCKVLLLKDSIVTEKLKENKIDYNIVSSVFYKKYYHYFTHSEADYIKWFNFYTFLKLTVFWFLSRYFFAKRELKDHEFDIVHLNSSVLTDWLAPSSRLGKVIIHIREPFRKGRVDFLYIFFKRQMNKYADKIIAISQDNADRVGLNEKTTIVYNYSEIQDIDPYEEEGYKTKTVLYVGGYSRIKGFFTVVKSLENIDDDIKIIFAGYYPKLNNSLFIFKNFLRSFIFKEEHAMYKKFLDNKKIMKVGLIGDINNYIDESTCLISPFTVPHFSRPIIEAFARRKPAIATEIDGMSEIIASNINGVLIKEGDSDSLAKAINYICNNPLQAKKMGDNGYLVAKKRYSSKNIKKIQKLYNSLT